jgi:endogenous inhibitor of DNA gyrase (YacG/DUF329 family)
MRRCPICNAEVKPRGENVSFPFCSPRCKTIDLGKWLSEEYRVPSEDVDDDDVSSATEGSPSERDVTH